MSDELISQDEQRFLNLNKLLMIGEVTTKPEMKTLANGTKSISFMLITNEFYHDKEGNPKKHTNTFRVEMVGRNAEDAYSRVVPGCVYILDGYMRHEKNDYGGNIFKVRAYTIKEIVFSVRQMMHNLEYLNNSELRILGNLIEEKLRRIKSAKRDNGRSKKGSDCID